MIFFIVFYFLPIDPMQMYKQALFALLYSQALDKNYIDETNDSLIGIAVEYYNAHPEPYRLMLAYYYLSRMTFA